MVYWFDVALRQEVPKVPYFKFRALVSELQEVSASPPEIPPCLHHVDDSQQGCGIYFVCAQKSTTGLSAMVFLYMQKITYPPLSLIL